MDSPSLLDRVRELRGEGQTPKQIARALGISPSAITPLIRAIAAEAAADRPLGEVLGCWVNRGWSTGLSIDPATGWTDEEASDDLGTGGLAAVLVARKHGWDKVSHCGYLVDAYCLGVKNAHGPEVDTEQELRRFREQYFGSYDAGYRQVPVELAQHLVFGARDYARGLGFEPHPDFAAAAPHLGDWSGRAAITFGRDGKPLYISGPYDDARKVIKTLEKNVGEPPKFDYVLMGQPAAFS
jgi:hypothetical protein